MAKRNYIIDGLRGLSIILVVGIHYFDVFNFIHKDIYRAGGIINTIFGHGYYGVTIFFVISGYLITSSNVEEHKNGALFVQPRVFYSKRATRIIPLLLLIVIISATIIYSIGVIDWKPYVYVYQVGNAGYGPGFWSAILFFYFNWLEISWVPYNDGWFGLQWNILWSLAVEEQFYLVFPWMVAVAKTRAKIITIAFLLLIIALIIRAVLIFKGASPAIVYDNSICCFDALFAGVFIGLIKASSKKLSKTFLISGFTLFILCYLLPYYALAGTPVLGMVAAAGLIIHGSRAFQGMRQPQVLNPLCKLGSMSYGAYLLHPPALLIIFACMQMVGASAWLGFGASLILTYILAKISFYTFEVPIERKLRSILLRTNRNNIKTMPESRGATIDT